MTIELFDNYDLLSGRAAETIYQELILKPDLILCTASGKSPKSTYKLLAERHNTDPGSFRRIRILKLDEWGGISMKNPQSCEVFLQDEIIKPLQVDKERYISFNSNPKQPAEECERIDSWLIKHGPIDVCVLGLGLNGHIAFNEPGKFLQPGCHIASLSDRSMQHPMAINMGEVPGYGLTLGMTNILQSKKIILLITGKSKKNIIEAFLTREITTELPASFLWLHSDVLCLIDKNAM